MKVCMQPTEYTHKGMGPVVDELSALLDTVQVMGFTGPLGAGKTTLVQQLLRRRGVSGAIASPTFSYVHSYRMGDELVHHFDLYRLTSLDDFIEAGFDEYLYQPGVKALVEWPEIVMPLLNREACIVTLDYVSSRARRIQVCCVD